MWSLKIEFKVITPGRRPAQITVEAAKINDEIAKQATEAPGKKNLLKATVAVVTTE
jgi:hypothetical protein